MNSKDRDDSGQEIALEGGEDEMLRRGPYCTGCEMDHRFLDDWVRHWSCERCESVEVSEPDKVCKDCRKSLPPGDYAHFRWYFSGDVYRVEIAGPMERESLEREQPEEQALPIGPDPEAGRFILCPRCHRLGGPENEGDVIRHGLVILPDTSCTTCHKPLPLGSSAIAETFYGNPQHYQPWEHHHLRLLDAAPRRGPLRRLLDPCSRLLDRLRLTLSQIHHTRPS